MDSEAAVIKSEMMRTRADLDRKIAQLEVRARELTPRRYLQRYLPENALDRALGGVEAVYVALDLDVLAPGEIAMFMPEPDGPSVSDVVRRLHQAAMMRMRWLVTP